MRVDSLRLRGFRNYADSAAEFAEGINVISGPNAQGKTNLLEAVYLLAGGRSFRTRFDKVLISFDRDAAEVSADVFAAERAQHIDILLQRGRKKLISVNKVKKSPSELSECINAVLFCPDDLNLIREGAAARRKLMDLAI